MIEKVNIKTERLIIGQFEDKDISETYISWLNDPYLMRFSNQRFTKHTGASCKEYLSTFKNSSNQFLKITDLRNNKIVGTATVYCDNNHRKADIGILIGIGGNRYGTEAWNAIVHYLIGENNVYKLTAGTVENNHAMRKIIENSGFYLEATRYRHELIDNKRVNIMHYAFFS